MAKKSNSQLWLLTVAFALVALAVGIIPLLIIQPFKPQQQDQLLFALALKRWSPFIAVLCILASLTLSRRLRRWPAYVASILTIAFAAISFINVFEIMFHPIDQPVYGKASEAKVEVDDMLLTVKLGGQSRAYPVRTLAYHHLVNDKVNGVPIVATY